MSLSLRVAFWGWSEGKPKETTHSRPARLAPRFPGAGKSVARIGKNVTPVGDMGRNQKTQNVGVCNKKRGPAWLRSDFTSKPTKRGFWGGWSLGNPQICPKRYKERHRAYRSGVMVVAYRCATNIGSVRKLAYLYVLRKFGDNPLHSPFETTLLFKLLDLPPKSDAYQEGTPRVCNQKEWQRTTLLPSFVAVSSSVRNIISFILPGRAVPIQSPIFNPQ